MLTMKNVLSAAFLCVFFSLNAMAITWFPKEFTCPIDDQKNTFMVVGSYGSYIYSYPSKYQWLFFPQTDSPTFYTCKKCKLTTYMWDFDELPKEKLTAIKEVLKDVTVSRKFEKYTELPVTERLEIMSKVYAVLDKDDDWWETFNRVKGYHYGAAGDKKNAEIARKRSIELLLKLETDKESPAPRKILYYIIGSMKHFTEDDRSALEYFEKALNTKYSEKDADKEELENAEKGLNERLKEYIELIKSGKDLPRSKETSDGHSH